MSTLDSRLRLRLRPRRRAAVRQSNREADAEIAWLSSEERALRDRIADLERFIVRAPELAEHAQHAQRERLNTLPPPEESMGGGADEAPLRRTRSQEAAIRRRRALNLAVFLVVAATVAALALWMADNL